MNVFVKSGIAFVVLFLLVMAYTYVHDVMFMHQGFVLDLAWAMGVSAGGAVMILVHDLTKGD